MENEKAFNELALASDAAGKPYESTIFHETDAPEINRLFKHKTIRRFRFGDFEFKNYHIRFTKQAEVDRFLKELATLPRIETVDIVEINEEAASMAERQVIGGPTAIRGAMSSEDILTVADKERLAKQQAAPTPTDESKPATTQTGMGISGFLKKS